MAWCLTKEFANKFKQGLKDRSVDPNKLAAMTSAQRNEFFTKFVGAENAQNVNGLFESKLLLKNQKVGMITWAKRAAGITPKVRRDLITRIERLEKVLDPTETEQFLNDLVSTRLKIDVTQEEAKIIADFSKEVGRTKEKINDDFTFDDARSKDAYGRAVVDLDNYVKYLKEQDRKQSLGEQIKKPTEVISGLSGQAKSMKASMDNSTIFRQGWKVLFTHPKIWARNAKKSFKDIWDTFGKKKVMDELNADIVSRQNALNGNYKAMKLAVGTIEEAFPSSLPERLPLIGRAFKASESAFTAFVHKTRADVADKYLEVAASDGVDLTDKKELRSIGIMVNSLTGRGALGKAEPAADIVNNIFFAPRHVKSQIDFLTAHWLDGTSTFAKKQATLNLFKVVTGSTFILALAKAIDPDSVEDDPRSANFGKIKVGNTRFDVTGGMSSMVTLIARQISGASKSSITGEVKPFGTGFGETTRLDAMYNFFENKLSPATALVKNLLKGETFGGEPITVTNAGVSLVVPISIENYVELENDPDSANAVLAMIADGLGIATNTYAAKTNWSRSKSKELQAFKEQVGEKEFKEANKEFNAQYQAWLKKTLKSEGYTTLPQESRIKLMTNAKATIKDNVFADHGFKHKTEKTKVDKPEKKIIKGLEPESTKKGAKL